jgi:hypothetical protein
MLIFQEAAVKLKGFVKHSGLNEFAQMMMFRMVIAFIFHRGRMSCSQAAVSVASDSIHRGELTRFLARPRWKNKRFNEPLMQMLLAKESLRGMFLFIVDATLISQSGRFSENTYSTQNRKRRSSKRQRYGKRKYPKKQCHSFTFGLLITPSGIRIPLQVPHYTAEYCAQYGVTHLTTAEAAAQMIRSLSLPERAQVIVLGDTAYESHVVRQACRDKGYTWIFPANAERVYEGPKGKRPKLRSRLKDWKSLSLAKIRLRASAGKYVTYRRLSKWRIGPKLKARVYHAYQEKCDVRSVGNVLLIFSTMKEDLVHATPDDVKILMTNATCLSMREVIDLYSLRWQIELFFKEIKSTLGFNQYSFKRFEAVLGWVELTISTVLFLEYQRACKMADRRLTKAKRLWWSSQRLHGLCSAFRQECQTKELKFLRDRLKTQGGIHKLKHLIAQNIPTEFNAAA